MRNRGTAMTGNTKKRTMKHSIWNETWRRLRRNRLAMVGLCILAVLAFLTIFADFIADYDALAIRQNTSIRLQLPSLSHPFGTDDYGRDLFARIIHGARVSLSVSLLSTAVSIVLAFIIGSVAVYYGGIVDSVIMRILDMFMGIPLLLLAIAISASLGPGIGNLLLAITIAQVPGFTRIVRSVILNIYGQEYIEAARAYGAKDTYIIFAHILPNAMGPIIVQATMSVANVILNTAALSYLGMGMQPPAPELGSMLSDGKEFLRYSPYLVTIPGLTIVVSALSLNLLGDGLRDALDPRLKN